MQARQMRFSQKIKGVTMFDKLRNTAIRESLNIELLLLRIERSQLKWFGYVSRMPHERLPKQTFSQFTCSKITVLFTVFFQATLFFSFADLR